MTTTTLRAPAMCCGNCVTTIKRAVGRLPGVQAVDGDPTTKQVMVKFDEQQVSLAQITTAMAEEGYPVES